MNDKDRALTDFLERLRDEISVIEKEYSMQISHNDLRLPVDAYHDAVDMWRNGHMVEVDDAAWGLDSIRKRANWLRVGAEAFWQDKDANYKKTLAAAVDFKRWCIRNAGRLDVSASVMQEDLVTFALWVKSGGTERIEREMKSRMAEKFSDGKWVTLGAEEFWSGLAYTAGFFNDMALQLRSSDGRIMLGDGTNKPTRFSADDWHMAGMDALKALWVQIQHPIALKSAFRKNGDKWQFNEALYVPEAEWQRMKVDSIRLADAYEHYALLYAAALAQSVDASYKLHRDNLDSVVSDSYSLLKLIERLESGGEKLPIHQLERLVRETENDELRRRLQAILDSQRVDKSGGGMKNALNGVMQGAENELAVLEKNHFQFLSNQLSVYEEGKNIIKQLAGQGLNLAGKFVAAAAAATARGRGGSGGRT